MTITLEAQNSQGRVHIEADGLLLAEECDIERSPDTITWTTVRGGADAAVIGGAMVLPLYDYEFDNAVVNYYRVRSTLAVQDTFTRVAASGFGTADFGGVYTVTGTAANYSCTGTKAQISFTTTNSFRYATLPDDYVNVSCKLAQIVNVPAATPTGAAISQGIVARFTDTNNHYLARLSYKTDNTIVVQICRRAAGAITTLVTSATLAGVTTHTTMALRFEIEDGHLRARGWDASLLTEPVTWDAEVDDVVFATGKVGIAGNLESGNSNTTPMAWQYDDFTVDDGNGHTYAQDSLTPAIEAVWLKSVARPFLNTTVQQKSDALVQSTQPARTALFDIVGRSLPVAVSDVRSSKRWTLQVETVTALTSQAVELLLASGDVLFIQCPEGCPLPITEAYVAVGDVVRDYHPLRPLTVTWSLPLTEVAAPGPDVIGAQSTWQTVLDTYATWEDLIAAKATWADVLQLVGDGSEVIVP